MIKYCALRAFGLLLLLLWSGASLAAPAKVCEQRVDFRLGTKSIGWLTCNDGLRGVVGTAALYDNSSHDDDPTVAPTLLGISATVTALPNTALRYSEVHFSQDLDGGKSYLLKIIPTQILDVSSIGPGQYATQDVTQTKPSWAPIFITLSTKASAVLATTKDPQGLGESFTVLSDIGIAPCTAGQNPKIKEILPNLTPRPHPATMRRYSLNFPGEVDQASSNCQLPFPDAVSGRPQFDAERIGQAEIQVDGRFRQAKAQLDIDGVKDAFGQPVTIPKDKQKITLKDVPKGKDDATYYLNFSNQAGPGAKPSWALDSKLAPMLPGQLGGFFPTLNLLADVGFNNTKSANTIKFGAGLTRLFLTQFSDLQGIRFSPVVNYETDRDFDKHNLVVEPDFRFYLPFMNHSRDLRSRRSYINSLKGKTGEEILKTDPNDPKFRKYAGFFMQLWLGAETGGSLVNTTVTTKDKSSSVQVPGYGIFRPRPRLQTAVELWRMSVNFSITPRYIAETEYVGTIVTTTDPVSGKKSDHAVLNSIQGWRGYGELGLQFALDRSSHISLTTTYKRGSAPPTFEKVDTVLSGLSIKY